MDLVIPIIIPYIPDIYKLYLLSTCKTFRAYLPQVKFTGVYDYGRAKKFQYIHNIQNIQFNFSISYDKIRIMEQMEGFVLGRIPSCVTILYYDSDVPLRMILHSNIREIILKSVATVSSLPDHVKKITVKSNHHYKFRYIPKHIEVCTCYNIWYNATLDNGYSYEN